MKKFAIRIFLAGHLLCLPVVFATAQPADVIAYYTGDAATLRKYPVQHLTQIIYSFLHLKHNKLAFDNEQSRQNFLDIVMLKKEYPRLKVLVSLGGWTGCYSCSPIFSSAANRDTFATSVLNILKETNADGIDLDWEYPSIDGPPGHPYSPNDKANFTALLQVLRATLGPQYELSFAAGGFQKYIDEAVDWGAVMPLVNRVNLMTYDLVNGYSTVTGHHTALYSTPQLKESTDNCVQALLRKKVPAEKLVIGAAFYARTWKDVPDKNHGLYQSGVFKSGIDFKHFPNELSKENGFKLYWDKTAKAPYMYNASKKEFATFDNKQSLKEKVSYVEKHKLGGIMFWELTNDTYQNGLLQAISEAVKKIKP
ncbi:MAG TPA: glycoside hydrolase family 18 protein [Phnomibacter sp.]|nr:glycoside hydrolase family 18 protein [Phnomibacter sp.]